MPFSLPERGADGLANRAADRRRLEPMTCSRARPPTRIPCNAPKRQTGGPGDGGAALAIGCVCARRSAGEAPGPRDRGAKRAARSRDLPSCGGRRDRTRRAACSRGGVSLPLWEPSTPHAALQMNRRRRGGAYAAARRAAGALERAGSVHARGRAKEARSNSYLRRRSPRDPEAFARGTGGRWRCRGLRVCGILAPGRVTNVDGN